MDKIPLNESMIEAEVSKRSLKTTKKKKKSRHGQFVKKASRYNRERSNTEEEEVKKDSMIENTFAIKVNESYMEDAYQQSAEHKAVHDISGEGSTYQNSNLSIENSDNKKDSYFISKIENDEEEAKLSNVNSNEYDLIGEKESELSFTISLDPRSNLKCNTARSLDDEVSELYIDEPKWNTSSSWVKPMPHRVYKIKTVWSNPSTFDTDVHRRYKHFSWLRKILIKEYEHCAVPTLPDKAIFEKVFGHSSDFIKERMRKMKHFLTLIISHSKLKNSDYFRSFLCENDKVFKVTLKNNQVVDEDEEQTPVTKNNNSWMSLASSSFGKVWSKAKEWDFDKMVPGITQLLSTSDEELGGHDLIVKKIEDKLETLKIKFVEFYKLAFGIYECRINEYSIEKKNELMVNECKVFSQEAQDMVDMLGEEASSRGEVVHDNIISLRNIIYATESHLVWIDSVCDLVNRKHDIGTKITEIKNKIKKNDISYDNVETCRRLLKLTERREAIIKGIMKEMDKLSIGTKDFYTRNVQKGFLQVAYGLPFKSM